MGNLVLVVLRTRRRRHRQSRRRAVRLTFCVLTFLVLAVGYVVGMSQWQAAGEPLTRYQDLLIPRMIDVLIVSWLLFIGASIGSFLNVVAWRMPRGKSINGRSHCPRCDNRLAWRDNLPVLGWIILGGRCRYCRLPISPRYPIVEAAVGLSVLLVAMPSFFSNAANLPFSPHQVGHAAAFWIPDLSPRAIAVIVYHVAAVAAVWALALVRGDGVRIPRNLAAWCLALTIAPMLAFPTLAIVPWTVSAPDDWTADGDYLNAALRVLTALAMAGLLGRMLARYLCPTADPKLNPLGAGTARLMDLILLMSTVTIVVGWQAALPVTVLATLAGAWVPSMLVDAEDPLARFALGVPVATSIQIAYWGNLHELLWWPSVNTPATITLVWGAVILVLPRMLVSGPRHRATEPDPDPTAPD